MSGWRQIFGILRKDLLIELRSKEIIMTMLMFALTVAVLFNFVFDPGSVEIKTTTPAIFWVALIFAGNLGLGRSFSREQENGAMQGLLLCPVDRSLIYAAKMLGNMIYITAVELIVLPVMVVLFDLSLGDRWLLFLLILFLGSWGFSGLGTLFSAMAANTRSREVMLPILLFPVSVPVILAAVKSTAYLLNGRDWPEIWSWLRLLMVFDVLFFTICFLLYEYVIEE